MFCKACQYNLRGAISLNCPECGHQYDPASPKTFNQTPAPPPTKRITLLLATFLGILLLPIAGAMWAAAIGTVIFSINLPIDWMTVGALVAILPMIAAAMIAWHKWSTHHWPNQRRFTMILWSAILGWLPLTLISEAFKELIKITS